MNELNLAGQKLDPVLVKNFCRQIADAYNKLDGRKSAKRELDEHLDNLKRYKGKLNKKHIEELKKKVDRLIERERRILHKDNRYIEVHETNGKKAKEIKRLESLLSGLEKKYNELRNLGVDNLMLRKIEARIDFLKTKIEFLKY